MFLILFMTIFFSVSAEAASLEELHRSSLDRSVRLRSEFEKLRSSGDVRNALVILEELSIINISSKPREIFSMCRKIKYADCSLFKAKVLESEGNAGSAMELYLRAGRLKDYLRLKALSGQDVEADLNAPHLSKDDKDHYRGLSSFSKGQWGQAGSYFSSKGLRARSGSRFLLFYSYLMLGDHENARLLIDKSDSTKDIDSLVDGMKMKAMMLYADNEQYKAMAIFKNVLKFFPDDAVCSRYLAHIYYRTGWFELAERIYYDLISAEWRDTERFYLLSERIEMRIRYLMPERTFKDADSIIKEYPDRPDFVANYISWLLEYGFVDIAERYLKRIPLDKGPYTGSLRYFSEGLIMEFKSRYKEARDLYSRSYELYPALEYKARVEALNSAEKLFDKNNEAPRPVCRNYSLRRGTDGWTLVNAKGAYQGWQVKYFAMEKDGLLHLFLKLRFNHDKEMNFGEKGRVWSSSISSTWSYDSMLVKVVQANDKDDSAIDIEVVPWPSYFYMKRASSHEWSLLTPLRVIDHEAGHLFGLLDEYYETDVRISSRNLNRYIGEPTSIMRNMLSGIPQKRHIQFILSSLKCVK